MEIDEVPEDIRDFLYERIESYEELTVLLWLHTHASRGGDTETIARDARIPMESAAQALSELRAKGLVTSRDASTDSFTLAATESDSRTVARLAALYESRPLDVMKTMNANAIQRLRTSMMKSFANAFIVGGKKKDG